MQVAASAPSPAIELHGRPVAVQNFRVRNTFIDVDEVAVCGSTQKRNSAPASCIPPMFSETFEQAMAASASAPQSLGQLQPGLLSGHHEEPSSAPCVCADEPASVAPTASRSESCQVSKAASNSAFAASNCAYTPPAHAFSAPMQVPYMPYGNFGGFDSWAQAPRREVAPPAVQVAPLVAQGGR